MKLLRHAVAAEHRIEVEEIVGGNPFVETQLAGRKRVAGEDGAAGHRGGVPVAVLAVEMPFAEVARRVAGRLQDLRDRQFLRADRRAGVKGAHAMRMPPGHDAGARGRAVEVRGVEAVQSAVRSPRARRGSAS